MSRFVLGNCIDVIRDSEIQNFCLHGTVGAGKSEVTQTAGPGGDPAGSP
ncbi:hypothetical protein DDM29_004654 [Escherichia coli]|nr:hypothetical protein [Escherichia coli]